MKKSVIFSIFILGILTLPACDFFKIGNPATEAAINAQTETNVLGAFQEKSSSDLVAASIAKKTTKQWDGNYSISGSILCKYNRSNIPPTTIPIPATPLTVSNNILIDPSVKDPILIDSKGKATTKTTVTDQAGIKTVIKMVYQFSKTGVRSKAAMAITIPKDGKIIIAKCSGTLPGKKQK